jgi:hypothetical protein
MDSFGGERKRRNMKDDSKEESPLKEESLIEKLFPSFSEERLNEETFNKILKGREEKKEENFFSIQGIDTLMPVAKSAEALLSTASFPEALPPELERFLPEAQRFYVSLDRISKRYIHEYAEAYDLRQRIQRFRRRLSSKEEELLRSRDIHICQSGVYVYELSLIPSSSLKAPRIRISDAPTVAEVRIRTAEEAGIQDTLSWKALRARASKEILENPQILERIREDALLYELCSQETQTAKHRISVRSSRRPKIEDL